MKLGMEVGLIPGHIVLDGDTAPPSPKGHSPHPQFSSHVCGQTAEMGDRLATIDIAEKRGLCPFGGGGAGLPLNTMSDGLRPTSLDPLSRLVTTDMAHLTQCRLGCLLPPYQVVF